MDRTSVMTRAALAATLLVLTVALGALVSRPDLSSAQEDVDVEVLDVVLTNGGSPGVRPAPSAQLDAAQTGGPGGNSAQDTGGQGGGPSSSVPPGPPGHAAQPRTFGIGGSVAGLYPGIEGNLVLTVSNPHNFEIVVTEVTADVSEPTGPDDDGTCRASHVQVDHFVGSAHIPPKGTAEIDLDITMLHTTPDACQGAQWGLTYAGSAIRANQQ